MVNFGTKDNFFKIGSYSETSIGSYEEASSLLFKLKESSPPHPTPLPKSKVGGGSKEYEKALGGTELVRDGKKE